MPETALNPQSPTVLLDAVAAVTDLLERDEPPAVEVLGGMLIDGLVRSLPAARCGSIVRVRARGRIEAVATTGTAATHLDAAQASTRQGPILTALRVDRSVTVIDLCTDARWPALARAVARGSALRSAMCVPVTTSSFQGSLNLYSDAADAFGHRVAVQARAVAAVSRLVVLAAAQRKKVANLAIALETNRRIGAAVGILVASHQCSYDDAVAMMVSTSQQNHRKLGDIAEDILRSGALLMP